MCCLCVYRFMDLLNKEKIRANEKSGEILGLKMQLGRAKCLLDKSVTHINPQSLHTHTYIHTYMYNHLRVHVYLSLHLHNTEKILVALHCILMSRH